MVVHLSATVGVLSFKVSCRRRPRRCCSSHVNIRHVVMNALRLGQGAPSAFSPWVFEVSISRLLFLTAIYSHLCLGTKLCAAALRTWRFVSAATTTGCRLNYTGCKHPLLHFHRGFKSFRDRMVGCNLILFSFCVNKFEDGVQINFIDLVCTHKHKHCNRQYL